MSDQSYRGLDVDEDMHIKHLTWRGEVFEYALLLTLVVAGLLGMFGDGWLSSQEVGAESGFTVRWERFQRRERATILDVDVAVDTQDRAQLTVSNGLMDGWTIESLEPQPVSQTPNENSVTYTFPAAVGTKTGRVVFELTPKRAGPCSFRVNNGDDTVPVNVFVYP